MNFSSVVDECGHLTPLNQGGQQHSRQFKRKQAV
jgi:hypothetical protein